MNIAFLSGIFFTGLLTGGLSCLAVQGGLLASTLANRQEEILKNGLKQSDNALPILSFLAAKLTAYTFLGLLLGLFGSFFQLNVPTRALLQFMVAVFMIGSALNLLNVHPIFRFFAIQPPKFITRIVRKESKSSGLFAPIVLGVFTIFIPCGTTQAMMALAIGSQNPLIGSLIMFAFILGTSPLFFILGYFTAKIGGVLQQGFLKFAAVFILILALYNMEGAFALAGTNFSFKNLAGDLYCVFIPCTIVSKPIINSNNTTQNTNPSEENLTINFDSFGYNPNRLSIKTGSKVNLNLVNKEGRGCIQAFVIPSLNIQKIIPVGSSETISFTAPLQPTKITFMCSMGMFRGEIDVE